MGHLNLLLFDESRFCVDFEGEMSGLHRPVLLSSMATAGFGMVWTGIRVQGTTELHTFVKDFVAAVRYVH